MTEREKVIKGLETCIEACQGKVACLDCNYDHDYGGGCEKQLLQDALELLKAQEPATVIQISWNKTQMSGVCPSCMMPITSPKLGSIHVTTHCQFCGKAVKWDD